MVNLESFITSLSSVNLILVYITLFLIIFAETGLMVGFFLPGDSLLFTTGILASQGHLNLFILCPILFFAAVIGDSVGYMIGHKFGKKLFKREDSFFFHKDHLLRAKKFYDIHGGKTIIIARFLAVIRTFAPVVAGMGDMNYGKFLSYNIIGAGLWAIGLPILGFYLGTVIPSVDKYILPILGFVVITSLLPGFYHALRTKEQRSLTYATVRIILQKIFPKRLG